MLKESNNDVFYVFTARPSPWVDENSPPAVDKSVFSYDNDIFKHIIFGKKVNANDTISMIPRINWTANTIYGRYDPTKITDTSDRRYYVLTTDKKVFKCIDNNKNSPSLIEPFLDSRKTFSTSDGYSWRYLYSITDADFDKFATNRFIPVTPNTVITAAAVPGTIDHIEVQNSGAGYYSYNSGNTIAVIDNTNFVIGPLASANSGFYVNNAIFFKGDLISAVSKVVDYNGSTKMITVDPPINLRVELTLANSGAGTFTSNLTARQEYFEVLLSNTTGTSLTPDLVITQRSSAGANLNYIVINTFDGGARIHRSDSTAAISLTDPWRSASGETVLSGVATSALGSNVVTGSGGTLFSTNLTSGDFIRIGSEVRQIATVSGASSLTTTQTWSTSYSSNTYIKPSRAGFFQSATQKNAEGVINSVDVTAATIYLSSITGNYEPGEVIYQANSSGTIATGLVIDSNTSSIYIGNVSGSFTYTSNLYVIGVQSGALGIPRANNGVVSSPRLLIANSIGVWYSANISAVTTSNAEIANAKIAAVSSFPGTGTPYIISPRVVIEGDGDGAFAYSVINTASYSIDSIIVVNTGIGYTYANTYLESNSVYGVGGALTSIISPVRGIGANVQNELNSKHTGISVQFQNSSSESYYFSTNGTFRQIGLIRNPEFKDITLSVNTFSRASMNISNTSADFFPREIILQAQTAAVATVIFSNSTYIEVENMSEAFSTNNANDYIIGTMSGSTANVKSYDIKSFPVNTSITQTIFQDSTEANGVLLTANSIAITLTGVQGVFTNSSSVTEDDKYRGSYGFVYDKSSNSAASITDVGTPRKLSNFTFDKFNQLYRVVVDSTSGSFINNETVTQDNVSGRVYNSNTDNDLIISGTIGSFVTGDSITQTTTGATASVVTANSTYLRLTSVNGSFLPSYEVVASGSGANAITSTVYNILNLYDTDGEFRLTTTPVVGSTSNAQATTVSNRSIQPDLVRNTGEVLYIQNSTAVLKSATSKEQIKIVVQYL